MKYLNFPLVLKHILKYIPVQGGENQWFVGSTTLVLGPSYNIAEQDALAASGAIDYLQC